MLLRPPGKKILQNKYLPVFRELIFEIGYGFGIDIGSKKSCGFSFQEKTGKNAGAGTDFQKKFRIAEVCKQVYNVAGDVPVFQEVLSQVFLRPYQISEVMKNKTG
jgi:hypothetical protein